MPAEANPTGVAETFEKFVAAINSHDAGDLAVLMTADHVFVDSMGNQVRGAATMQGGWRGYFAMCPDYAIRVSEILVRSETVVATGEAGGTIDGIAWKTPAAWKATVRDGLIAEWHFFADNKPVYEILARRGR
jgi:ketosteroid isomerase-like protein